MFKDYRIILIVLNFILPATFGNNVSGQNSIIPPPPEAASFFKSTEIPVSMYTGLPNIGVPLYSIKTKEMEIPIGINYNARGIQVAEVASRVGLGWALQYGGMISRQIRGSADEGGWGILYHNYYNEVFKDSIARGNLHSAIVNNNIDEFPDQFFYDVIGESGKFTFDHNDGSVVLQKFSDIKIVPNITGEGLVSWIVTDKFGNKFYYGLSKDGTRKANDCEWTNQTFSFSNLHGLKTTNANGDRYYSAWHLMEIETYLNEKIEFFYELELGQQYRRSYDKVENFTTEFGEGFGKEAVSYFSQVTSSQYQIKEIKFTGGKINFESDVIERTDFANTYALKKLSVSDAENNLLKQFDFSQFYQRCTDDNNQLDYLKQVDTTANFRLILSSVKETSSIGTSLPPYLFEYNNVLLPNRFSNSQDNWGYYNGKANGRFLTFMTYNTPINRTVDTALVGAGLIKKITYPTGGSSIFSYEQNRVMPPVFIKDLLYNQNNPSDTVVIGEGLFRDSAYYANGKFSKEITIGQNIAHLSSVTFSFVQPMQIDTTVISYEVILERLDSIGSIYLFPPDRDRQLNLSPGQYRLDVIPTANSDGSAFISGLHWTVINMNPHALADGEWYGAGKRIKRIEHRNVDELVSFKEYEYLDTSGKTSGKMLGLPNFHFIQKLSTQSGQIPFIDQYGSLPGSPLTQLQGNTVGYSTVTEYSGSVTSNIGKTENYFTNEEDGGEYYKFPYYLPISLEWIRGKPLLTKIFKKNAVGFELQKSVENTYEYAGSSYAPNMFTQPMLHMDSVYVYRKDRRLYYLPLFIFAPSDTFRVYYQTAGTFDLKSTREKEYVNGQVLDKEVEYLYDYDKHYQQVVQKTTSSKGDTTTSTTSFPLDINVRTAAEQKLVDQNRIAIPINVETTIKNNSNSLLSSALNKTVYKIWGSSLVLPEHTQSSINNAPLVNNATFYDYNSIGSPLEISPKSGVKEVYIWGYKKQYPVAKIVGSNYNSIISLVDTIMLDNAAQYTDAQIRTELNKIRIGLANTIAQVSTYTYKSLVGITSVTDTKNQSIYYEYDNFNRLYLVRDQNNNILKKICYNYAGQSQDCSCIGEQYRVVNGVCETSFKICTNSVDNSNGSFTNTYHYEWSNGQWSPNYTEVSNYPCGMILIEF